MKKQKTVKNKKPKIIEQITNLVRISDGREFKSYYICPSCNSALLIIDGTDCPCGRNVLLADGVKPKMMIETKARAKVSNGIVGDEIIAKIKKFRGHK